MNRSKSGSKKLLFGRKLLEEDNNRRFYKEEERAACCRLGLASREGSQSGMTFSVNGIFRQFVLALMVMERGNILVYENLCN